MKRSRILALSVLSLVCVLPTSALCQDEHPQHRSGGLGFHNTEAPLGGRWWLGGQKVGIDFGFGFSSTPAPSYDDESLMGWAIDVGVPLVLKNWEKVHFLFRPGLFYQSQEVQTETPPDPFDSDNATLLAIIAELEVEVFLVDNFSVSASHGIGFFQEEPAGGGDSETSFSTLGNNFSHIGFHIYLFGGGPAQ